MADTTEAPGTSTANFAELAAEIVSAFVANNKVAVGDLSKLIGDVHSALQQTTTGGQKAEEKRQEPAVSIRRSVQPDYIVCLEDGKHFKSLKRHLGTEHNMTPQEYREKWGLPRDYPMAAPNYAASRSEMAKKIGLGQGRRKAAEAEPAPQPKRRGGRPRKQAAE